jgi:hypothetical protein
MDSSTFEELKKLCVDHKATNIEIVNTIQKPMADGFIGIIENKFINKEKYEVYLYFQWQKKIASPLMMKLFNDKKLAGNYFNELSKVVNNNNLVGLIGIVKSSN